MAAAVEQVKQDATKALRNLPSAHGTWQRFWRHAWFRRAIGHFDAALYALSVDGLTDRQLQTLEDATRVVLKVVEIHASCLGDGVRDEVDRQYFAEKKARLKAALRGLEQGLAPDPSKRPSDEELMNRLAAGLQRAKLA